MSMTPAAGPGGRFRVRMPRPLYLQLLFVTLAFVLLVGTCGLYVSNMMREDLIGEAEDILLQTEIRITAELLEPEALMISVAKDIRDIIREGGSANDVRLYIDEISAELTAKVKGFHFDGIHGYFEALGNTYLPASGWFPPEDFSPTDRPWYITAVEAEGRIAVTPPYRSTRSGLYQVSYSCRLFDDAGSPMGAVALNVPLDNITRFVADTSLTENGYGVLIDERFDVIAHPVTEFIGRPMREIGHDVAELLAALEQGWNIAEFEMTNYQGETTVLFCLELDNGWYLGVMTPKSEYYQRLTVLMLYLCALGTVLMLTLILILIRIDAAKTRLDRAFEAQSVQLALMEEMREEDERTQIMLDSMPLCANFWSRDYTNTFTNEKSVQLFELSSKQEYIDRFHDLSPERQPDGEPSSEKAVRLVKEAFETGYCRFEWLHQKLNGEPLPCEITLARVRHRDNDIVLGYTRDLREEKAMLRKVMERGNLLETVSRTAA
ncbi:MAG: PAS domain-containing protein, partial [Oscillospiraceae bacterium]|nr:PAS domain-containing protein [Oscillospiraceae bacterium]